MKDVSLPTDIVLHILSYLSLSEVCKLYERTNARQLNTLLHSYTKQSLFFRVQHQHWTLLLYLCSDYFAILCNRDIASSSRPISQLICTNYNSSSEYLRFKTTASSSAASSCELEQSPLSSHETISMKLYCPQWLKALPEDNTSNQIELPRRKGKDQVYITNDFEMHYTLAANECDKRASLSLHVSSIRVSFHWLKKGLFV